MNGEIKVSCPECELVEHVEMTPTFKLGFEAHVKVIVTSCSECGYEKLDSEVKHLVEQMEDAT